ncbi:fog: zn-finger [Ceraceosorus bombacis]|uniref:Fog: zn-finger n=2 Tax=Ceraceosorus TaxID=401624 RepID=A0A0P1BR51_9BASI|nr:fog: zn-finger [Ceraceosorus bombacis]
MMDESYFAGLPAQASNSGLFRLSPSSYGQDHHDFPFQSTSSSVLHGDGHPPFIFDVQSDTKHQRGETSGNALASSTPLFVGEDLDVDDEDARFDSLGLPKRKRALQRLSLASSIASSVPSTAPSETDLSEYNEGEAGVKERRTVDFDDTTVGRSSSRLPDLVHSRSNSTMREGPTATSVFTAFNLSDFISDGAAGEDDSASPSASAAPSSFGHGIVEDKPLHPQSLTASSFTTPQRPGMHRDWSSLSASDACSEDGVERLRVPASPYSPTRLSNSSSSSLATSHNAALDLATASAASMQLSSPMMPNNTSLAPAGHHVYQTPHGHVPANNGLGLSSRDGVNTAGDMQRSMPNPHVNAGNASGQSLTACNPAHISPANMAQPQGICVGNSPSAQHYYPSVSSGTSGVTSPVTLEHSGLVYYPSSTPITPTSPFRGNEKDLWSAAPRETPASEMAHGEIGVPMLFSHSAPNHRTSFLQRGCESSPPSPLGPGHPLRLSRPAAHLASQQSSPYHGPHLTRPPQAMLPPHATHLSSSLQGLPSQNLYTGIITKRSRGRRVPNKPEEVNNLGKSGKIYTCKVPGCGKCFKRSEHLKRHVRSIHTDEKPYMCPFPNCFKRFSRHDNLNQHARVHAGTAPGDIASSSTSSMGGSVSPAFSPLSLSASFSDRRASTHSLSSLRHEDPAYGCDDVAFYDADDADEEHHQSSDCGEHKPQGADYDVQHFDLA